jgi:hypothetical protein
MFIDGIRPSYLKALTSVELLTHSQVSFLQVLTKMNTEFQLISDVLTNEHI